MNKRYKQICYLCGKKLSRGSSNRTVDHIPPRGFFPENFDRKVNLPTVLCCRKCNNSYARLDEEFRFLLSSGNYRSKAGDWIWNNKSEPKIGKSLINFCADLVRGFRGYEILQMEDSFSQAVNITVSYTEKILPFFSRLAKGFLVLKRDSIVEIGWIRGEIAWKLAMAWDYGDGKKRRVVAMKEHETTEAGQVVAIWKAPPKRGC